MKKYYITGTQGTGKTAVAEELRKRGFPVIDTDMIPVAYWRNIHTGEKVRQRSGSISDWIESHQWHCDPKILKELIDIQTGEIVFAVGISENQEEYIGLFDKIFLLQCSEETFLHRIETRTEHDFGKDESEREYILGFYQDFEKGMIERGAVSIDAEQTVSVVVDEILGQINTFSDPTTT